MGKLRKVVLSRAEVTRIVLAFSGEEKSRTATSHVRYRCVVNGQVRLVTVDESIKEFAADSHTALFYIREQLGVSWDDLYAADPDVAKRARVDYKKPK